MSNVTYKSKVWNIFRNKIYILKWKTKINEFFVLDIYSKDSENSMATFFLFSFSSRNLSHKSTWSIAFHHQVRQVTESHRPIFFHLLFLLIHTFFFTKLYFISIHFTYTYCYFLSFVPWGQRSLGGGYSIPWWKLLDRSTP